MEICNYRTPRWPSYQGKRKRNWDNRYQSRAKPNQGEEGHPVPMEIEGHYTNRSRDMSVGNLRGSAKVRGSWSNRRRNSFNEQRRPVWDYERNSRTFPRGKRRRIDCMQDDDVYPDYGHYKNRYKEGKPSFSSAPCDQDIVMTDSQPVQTRDAKQRAEVLSNDTNLKVYQNILSRLTAMRRYEESDGSDTKSSASKKSFLTWRGYQRDTDCESMDIDHQYVDTFFTTNLNEIQERLGYLDVFTADDVSLQCSQRFSNLFL